MWGESGPESIGRHNSGLSTFGVSVTVNIVSFHSQILKKTGEIHSQLLIEMQLQVT